MINPYYYLFYKLTRILNKKGNNDWGPIYTLSILLGMNIVIIYVDFFQITQENSEGIYKTILIIIIIVIFLINSSLFLNKQRTKLIITRYRGESGKSKKIGTFLVVLYVILSILLVFV
jgi:hypothetical protein